MQSYQEKNQNDYLKRKLAEANKQIDQLLTREAQYRATIDKQAYTIHTLKKSLYEKI